jgi:hypothetical protein
LGFITGQQSTGLFEVCNFGVNRSENLIYRHLESIPKLPRSVDRQDDALN